MIQEITTPLKAIRAYCLGCMYGSATEVRECAAAECELYAFRFGKNPYRAKREYSPEQLEAMRANIAKIRGK